MDPIGTISEGSLSDMYTSKETDILENLLVDFQLPNQFDSCSSFEVPSNFWHFHESTIVSIGGLDEMSSFHSSYTNDSDTHQFSRGTCSYGRDSSSVCFPTSSQESYYFSESLPMDFRTGGVMNMSSYLIKGDGFSNQEMSNDDNVEGRGKQKKELELPAQNPSAVGISENPSENTKKRSRISGDGEKNKKNVRAKKTEKASLNGKNNEGSNAGPNGRASSSSCSKDESDATHELNGEGEATSSTSSKGTPALNLNGKKRASRGAATDPQSLYARKRRERINERLRILQKLVPNGTKVDISTMLEEAVQYVKFLQLQIKMLSSDDLWMYAPIAYNGMNIGLDLKLTTPSP